MRKGLIFTIFIILIISLAIGSYFLFFTGDEEIDTEEMPILEGEPIFDDWYVSSESDDGVYLLYSPSKDEFMNYAEPETQDEP